MTSLWSGRLLGFCLSRLLRLGRLPTAALRLKSDGASASCTAGEAAARDAQQGDRDGRAPPFSGAKSARLTFPRPRGAPPCADFGRNGGAHLRGGLVVCEAAAAGATPHKR